MAATVARVSGKAEMAAITATAGRDSSDCSNGNGSREVTGVFVAARAATAVTGTWQQQQQQWQQQGSNGGFVW